MAAADAEAADDDLDTQTEAESAAPSAWWGLMWCGPVTVVNLDD